MKKRPAPYWYAVGLIGMAVLWEFATYRMHTPFMVSLTKIIPTLFELIGNGEAWLHIEASLEHLSLGFLLAAVIGFIFGLLISQSSIARAIVLPVVDSIRSVAALAIFPLLILFLGLGLWSKTFVIFWTAWPAILLSTASGIEQVDRLVIEASRIDGAGRLRMLFSIAVPVACPSILTGLRIGLSGGWISLVAAEMLGATKGLGYYVMVCSQTFRFAEMYAGIIFISLIGLGANTLMNLIQIFAERKLCLN